MSADQIKQMDAITNLAFKGIIGLCCFACSIIFYSMWGDIGLLKASIRSVENRLIKIETQADDRLSNDARRDKDIEDIKKKLNELK